MMHSTRGMMSLSGSSVCQPQSRVWRLVSKAWKGSRSETRKEDDLLEELGCFILQLSDAGWVPRYQTCVTHVPPSHTFPNFLKSQNSDGAKDQPSESGRHTCHDSRRKSPACHSKLAIQQGYCQLLLISKAAHRANPSPST